MNSLLTKTQTETRTQLWNSKFLLASTHSSNWRIKRIKRRQEKWLKTENRRLSALKFGACFLSYRKAHTLIRHAYTTVTIHLFTSLASFKMVPEQQQTSPFDQRCTYEITLCWVYGRRVHPGNDLLLVKKCTAWTSLQLIIGLDFFFFWSWLHCEQIYFRTTWVVHIQRAVSLFNSLISAL